MRLPRTPGAGAAAAAEQRLWHDVSASQLAKAMSLLSFFREPLGNTVRAARYDTQLPGAFFLLGHMYFFLKAL